MNPFPQQVYKFNDFKFDPYALTLHHRGEMIEDVDKKTLQVLAAIIAGRGNVVSHEDILEKAWPDDRFGATSTRVNQYASRLQKLFAKYEPDLKFIKNLRGRGYMFVGEAGLVEVEASGEMRRVADVAVVPPTPARPTWFSVRWPFVGAGIVVLLLGTAAFWKFQAPDDDGDVRRVVRESQMYESLVLYRDPASFNESELDKYWTTELDMNSNYDRSKIRTAVNKLISEGRRYGQETKCERFDFQSVEVSKDRDYAIAKTLENWFIAEYRTDGTLIKNKNVGPYFVTYNLRNIDGRWLIEKSNTARANIPAPRLTSIEATSEVAAGRQFFITVTGQDFLPQAVSILVVGEGCPEANPCMVPNSALLKHSQLHETKIESIPLTLAPGDFLIYAQNGDKAISNPLRLQVPSNFN